ncbi:MAG TPA: NAD(P)-dependent oxidoreductase [Blastocatellia bacterium]|nr:NAD(P)-dependent oxidoreductase [Blastocatellia bacterium]
MDCLTVWRGKRVLVTGGTGFIGRHLIGLAEGGGIEIHNVSLTGRAPSADYNYQVDLCERERLRALLLEVSPHAIIHLAAAGASPGRGTLATMLKANVIGAENLLAAAEALTDRPLIVFAGSGLEYTPQDRPFVETDPAVPLSAYGVAKAAASLCAHFYASRLPITLLRIFDVYGPGDSEPRLVPYIVARSRRGEPIELTGCEQVRDYVYVQDVAEAFWRALLLPPAGRLRILNLGAGHAIRLRTLIETIAAILRERGVAPKLAFGRIPYRHEEPMLYAANIERLAKELRWAPAISLEEGLRQTVEAML